MQRLAQTVERYWWRKQPPGGWLQPLAMIYQWVNQRNLLQRHQRALPPPLPTVFVGNITVGGSGKTPFVMALAQALQRRGAKPVVVCRGDGGNRQRQPLRVTAADDPGEVGDEACMMAQMEDVAVVVAGDRVAAATFAATLGDVMLLDDGLQYRQLRRVEGKSCEVVLLPASGVGNGGLLPIGPLREPLSALQRADVVVISGEEAVDESFPIATDGCFFWNSPVIGVHDLIGIVSDAPPQRIHLVTAIARPFRVVASLKTLGFEVSGHTCFADHHRYQLQDVQRLCRQQEAVVTTMKDAVKLRRLWPAERPLWVCQQQLQMDHCLLDRICASIGLEAVAFGSSDATG